MKPLRNEEVELQNIKLVRIVAESDGPDGALALQDQRSGPIAKNLSFLVIVVLPTLLAALYFFGLASARYQSEVKFVVRTPASSTTSALASLVQGSSVTRSGDDAFIAKEYMLSRDAMLELVSKDHLREMFDRAGLDLFWRYPFPFRAATAVGLQKHYLRFVTVDYDQSTGISTLQVQGFEAADAQRLASALLTHTEAFLNGLNTRAQSDAVDAALRDVEDAKKRSYAALDAVTAFRNRESVIDPTKSSTGIVETISRLSMETSTTNARLAELTVNTPQSPEISTLRTRLAALQEQVTRQRQMLGGTSSSLAPRIAEYERLLLEQDFSERAFISALTSLEAARLDAERQRVFLERVTEPDLPDFPAFPYRLTSLLGTLAVAYAVWRVFKVLASDTREHAKR